MREVAAISAAYAILLLGEEMCILQLNCVFSLMTLVLWGKWGRYGVARGLIFLPDPGRFLSVLYQ